MRKILLFNLLYISFILCFVLGCTTETIAPKNKWKIMKNTHPVQKENTKATKKLQ